MTDGSGTAEIHWKGQNRWLPGATMHYARGRTAVQQGRWVLSKLLHNHRTPDIILPVRTSRRTCLGDLLGL